MTVFFIALLGFFVLIALSVVMLFAGSLLQNVAGRAKDYICTIKDNFIARRRLKQEHNRILQQYGK